MRLAPLCLLVVACGSSDDDGPPAQGCESDDRSGTYRIHYDETSGDCGPLDDTLGRLDAPNSGLNACTVTAPDRTSDNGCSLERSIVCQTPDGYTVEAVAKTTQQDADGERITGVYDATLRDSSGAVACHSVYSMTMTRQ